ncbi:hypothetical protein [Pseudofrankia sp. BMG5.36]|uniref:hypothetical protein n=1 Tax=Pseudofrankia sp. BMG5.36 TaxID=1834512 RepID=UPI0008DA9898|nr:hypothetical protein [Pseudofrankia sp. BMG5.36]OHV56974.1 hypothetical protein BCD48_43525 [Pseudofrankia sp. BMG5.36]
MSTDYADEIARLESMIDELRRTRNRTCEPKNNTNPRYHALSSAVSSLTRAIDHMRAEATVPANRRV